MDDRFAGTTLHDLGTLFRFGTAAGLTDGQLLDRFTAGGDDAEAAFEGIVHRHGPMVLGVCRRTLGRVHSAEDAFQATFLVLAIRARSIRRRESLAPWLHGVASRLSRRTRAMAGRRTDVSCPLPEPISAETTGDLGDLRPVLDEELSRLPEKYRRPIVLCYLEGMTQEQAAGALGWTKGTVSGRLARAKDLLRGRLARRGLAPAVGWMASGSSPGIEAAAITMPATLVNATTRAAIAVGLGLAESTATSGSALTLARGAMRSMLVGRLKVAAVVLMTGTLGGALAIGYAGAEGRIRPETEAPPAVKPVEVALKSADPSLPPGARVRMGSTSLRHEGHVVRSAFSPDGKTLASAAWDGAIRFWDLKTGEPAPGLDPVFGREATYSLAYSPDGKLLALGRTDGTVQLRDLVARRERSRSKLHKGRVTGMAFAPDGLTFASSSDEETLVRVWDSATGQIRGTLDFVEASVSPGSLAFSPDGKRLALGINSKQGLPSTIRIWDLDLGGKPVVIRNAHGSNLVDLAFSKDSKSLISSGCERAPNDKDELGRNQREMNLVAHLARWDVRDGRRLWEMEPPGAGLLGGFALAQDGTTLVSAHQDRLLVWDLATGLVSRTIPIDPADFGSQADTVAISPDGRAIAMLRGDNRIHLLDFATGKPLLVRPESHDGPIYSAAFTPDSRTVATSGDDGKVRIWDAASGAFRRVIVPATVGRGNDVCASPDGRFLAVASEFHRAPGFGGFARIFDLSDGRLIHSLEFDNRATLVAYSADGRRMAVSTWNAEAETGVFGDERDGLPDNSIHLIEIGEVAKVSPIKLQGHKGKILTLAFAADGRSLVTVSQDRTFRFWDAETGKETRQIAFQQEPEPNNGPDQPPRQITSASLAPDLKWAVTGIFADDRVFVWDLTSGELLRTVRAEKHRSWAVAISPDGKRFSTVSDTAAGPNAGDVRIQIWDMASGRELLSLATGGRHVISQAFSPDGRSLVTGMADTTAIVWNLDEAKGPQP
ncbi:sigma-70 family RNA polymerase sigma factor [Isosphaeraceae bacterium EP7]